jgi:hypothetical protein
MKADITLSDAYGAINLTSVTSKARLIEFIERHWREDEGTTGLDPFSPEARLQRLEAEMNDLKEKCGFNGPYDAGIPLTNRIEYLEDWRRDHD